MVEKNDIEKQRASQQHIGERFSQSKDISITEFFLGDMHCEWVRPTRPHSSRRIILYCHGGGYSTGSCAYSRSVTAKLAPAAGMDILAFDYRLAPEYPYPAQVQDAQKAWDYLMYKGYGAGSVVLAGDSAGGNLALSLALSLKKQGRFLPRALLLLSPWTDLTCSGESHRSKIDQDPIIKPEYIDMMIEYFLAGNREEKLLKDPMVSPLYGDFHGFPPVYLQLGDQELLKSDSELLYKKMKKQGVNVHMDIYKGMWHVFQMSPFKNALEAIDQAANWLYSLN